MDNYQEWTDLPTVLKHVDKTEYIIKHIKHVHEGKHHTGSLKPNISAPNTGYQFMHSMFYKIIYFMLFCTFKTTAITSKAIIYVLETLSGVVKSTPIAICNWINKRSHLKFTSFFVEIYNFNLCIRYCRFDLFLSVLVVSST